MLTDHTQRNIRLFLGQRSALRRKPGRGSGGERRHPGRQHLRGVLGAAVSHLSAERNQNTIADFLLDASIAGLNAQVGGLQILAADDISLNPQEVVDRAKGRVLCSLYDQLAAAGNIVLKDPAVLRRNGEVLWHNHHRILPDPLQLQLVVGQHVEVNVGAHQRFRPPLDKNAAVAEEHDLAVAGGASHWLLHFLCHPVQLPDGLQHPLVRDGIRKSGKGRPVGAAVGGDLGGPVHKLRLRHAGVPPVHTRASVDNSHRRREIFNCPSHFHT